MPASSAARRFARSGDSVTATWRSHSASSSNGKAPGSIVVTNHRCDPSTSPRRTRGSTPARTTLDFPLPEPPTTSTRRPGAPSRPQTVDDRLHQVGATEEVFCVGLLERAQPLVGVRWSSLGDEPLSGDRGDEHGNQLDHRRASHGRRRPGEDIADWTALARPARRDHVGEVQHVIVEGSLRGAESEVREVRVPGAVEEHALRGHATVRDPLGGGGHQGSADPRDHECPARRRERARAPTGRPETRQFIRRITR